MILMDKFKFFLKNILGRELVSLFVCLYVRMYIYICMLVYLFVRSFVCMNFCLFVISLHM
jgi:hypothetical protein